MQTFFPGVGSVRPVETTSVRISGCTEHTLEQPLAQRIYGIALGYEDLNDHDQLRKDPLLAVVAGSKDPVGADRARVRDAG